MDFGKILDSKNEICVTGRDARQTFVLLELW